MPISTHEPILTTLQRIRSLPVTHPLVSNMKKQARRIAEQKHHLAAKRFWGKAYIAYVKAGHTNPSTMANAALQQWRKVDAG